MVRLVVGPGGEVVADLAGRAFGRGLWVHAAPRCIAGAALGGICRGLRRQIQVTPNQLWGVLRAAGAQRTAGLVAAAHRARKVAVGTSRVGEALAAGKAALVIVATDARAAADAGPVSRAIVEGRAVAWGSKAQLGAATGRGEVGVVAVLDAGLAAALSHALRVAQMPPPQMGSRSVAVDAFTEVR
jgi:ribosomal protein L7Ae-like RNA K-turn-binding protein